MVKAMGKPEGTGVTCSLDDITKWLPPVCPPNILAIGKNYPDHAKELQGQVPDVPILFIKATTSLIAHKEPIMLPKTNPDEVDYEAELAVVIGKSARHVNRADALDYVLGYCCAHDVSARDCQLRIDKQWARGKSFDTFC
ncbi:MAG: fumarylacetoacetate hydrolase family protein, partial [Planctomycetes bacterium]|nr:fumarylacetoacetate hydrolase family protein [Planctomycetota bacterium]